VGISISAFAILNVSENYKSTTNSTSCQDDVCNRALKERKKAVKSSQEGINV